MLMYLIISCLYYNVLSSQCTKYFSPPYTLEECGIIDSIDAKVILLPGPELRIQNIKNNRFPVEVLHVNKTKWLSISQSVISGTLPSEICLQSNLQQLKIFDISLSGSIPSCVFFIKGLTRLDILSTILGGTLPSMAESDLISLTITSSALQGTVPTMPPNLSVLTLKDNNLVGTLSSSLYSISLVDISFNDLSGTVPIPPPSTRIIQLILSYNSFAGFIPFIPQITKIDLSYNKFDTLNNVSPMYWSRIGGLILSGNRLYGEQSIYPYVIIDSFDVDECALMRYICPDGASCTDGWFPKMSYTCSCDTGYQMSPNGSLCIDINECLFDTNACSVPGTCLNTPGGYECCPSGMYASNSHCEQCYSNEYTYVVSTNLTSLPYTQTLSRCFGNCVTGTSIKYMSTVSSLCPIGEMSYDPCSYPCANATVGSITSWDAINRLCSELERGNYIDELTGYNRSAVLTLNSMSITLDIMCLGNCSDVVEAIHVIAPSLTVIETTLGVRIHSIGASKTTLAVVVGSVIGSCVLCLIISILAILGRDRTSKLHEGLARTIRVTLIARLRRQLFIETNYHPSHIRGIKRVRRVYNTVLLDNFVGTYLIQKERINNKLFHKKTWIVDTVKQSVYNCYLNLVKEFGWNTSEYPTVLSMMHGTSLDSAEKICETGFAALSTLDSGWYGAGIYFTSSFDYCIPYVISRKQPTIIISYILPGNVYPVVDSESHQGKPIVAGYSCHYVKTNVRGKPDLNSVYDEIVVAQESQILPMYIVELEDQITLPSEFTVVHLDDSQME